MGYGEYTGNQSVHWSVVHHNGTGRPGAIRGRDPIAFEDIGRDSARGLAPGKFRVRLRYGSFEEASKALASASVTERKGSYFLVFDVPVVNRSEDKVEPADPPSEVRVDW
jgi:hypothetical protein